MELEYTMIYHAVILWVLCFPAGYAFVFTSKIVSHIIIDPSTNSTVIFPIEVQICNSLVFIVLIVLALMASFQGQKLQEEIFLE